MVDISAQCFCFHGRFHSSENKNKSYPGRSRSNDSRISPNSILVGDIMKVPLDQNHHVSKGRKVGQHRFYDDLEGVYNKRLLLITVTLRLALYETITNL